MTYQFAATSPVRSARSDTRRWLTMAVLGTAFFLAMLDGTIVYVALPWMQRELDFSGTSVQWVMGAYLLCFGGLLPLCGRLAGALGHRRMFMVGLGVFTAGALLGGLAWSAGALVAGRAVQGIGAAILAPTMLPLLAITFDETGGRRRSLGIWTAIGAFGGTAGLVIGGTVTDGPGWRWIFLGTVPVCAGLLALGRAVLRDDRQGRDPGAGRTGDPASAAALTAGVFVLVYAITGTPGTGWVSVRTIGLFLAAAVLLAAFALLELRARDPLVPLRGLRVGTALGGLVVLFVAGMSLDGILFLLTMYAQPVLGFSATGFGLLMTAMTLSSVVGSFAGQLLVVRRGVRAVAAAGMALIGLGFLLLTVVSTGGGDAAIVFIGLLVFGPGLGASFVAAQIAVVSGFPEPESVPSGGLADSSFSIGGALGLAVLSTVVVAGDHGALGSDGRAVSPMAFTADIRSGFSVAVGLALLGLAVALTLLRPHPEDRAIPDHSSLDGDRNERINTES